MTQHITNYIQGDDTAEFLQKISKRLSGRDDCKDVEFEVKISDKSIEMFPLIYVFPDTYHRSACDKLTIISFIQQLMPNCKLTSGKYKYQRIATSARKQRRWIKI